MHEAYDGGSIEVICGSMFSGKSEELIRRVKRVEIAKKKIVIFKPAIDTRSAAEYIFSHNGSKILANCVNKSTDIINNIPENCEAVAIDEAQFFDNKIVFVCQKLADLGKRVIVAGLDQDFRGEPFGPIPLLLGIAEYVDKLHAICMVCGKPASRTQRIINGKPAHYNDPTILIGADETYEARCRKHHQINR